MPLLIILSIAQILFFLIGINTSPLVMIILPIGVIIFWWLINNPAISLMFLSLTAIIKGYLINYYPIFELIDITIVVTIIIWLGLIKMFIQDGWNISKNLKEIVYIFLLFGIILGLSYLYTPSPDYGLMKILRFNTFALTMFLTPFLIIKKPMDSKRLLYYFYFLIAIIVGIMLFQFIYFLKSGDFAIVLAYWNRISIPGANPIQVSRYLAIGAAMMIALLIRKKPSDSISYIVILSIILLTIILSGSRGPLVSIILGSIIYAILYERNHFIKIVAYASVAIGTIVLILLLLPENLTQRFFDISQGSVIITQQGVKRVSTIATRFEFWSMSLKSWISSGINFVFGLGSGGFSSLFIWRDWRWYPHNMFFEIIVELGLIGLIVLSLFITKTYKLISQGLNKGSFTDHSALWVAGTTVMFIAAQFSGDINDNRILWMFLAISIASTHVDRLLVLDTNN
tara:strand:- start:760 stop:2127 length:1368 start_codon:yes stop_codon:yes gene_type:complete